MIFIKDLLSSSSQGREVPLLSPDFGLFSFVFVQGALNDRRKDAFLRHQVLSEATGNSFQSIPPPTVLVSFLLWVPV